MFLFDSGEIFTGEFTEGLCPVGTHSILKSPPAYSFAVAVIVALSQGYPMPFSFQSVSLSSFRKKRSTLQHAAFPLFTLCKRMTPGLSSPRELRLGQYSRCALQGNLCPS